MGVCRKSRFLGPTFTPIFLFIFVHWAGPRRGAMPTTSAKPVTSPLACKSGGRCLATDQTHCFHYHRKLSSVPGRVGAVLAPSFCFPSPALGFGLTGSGRTGSCVGLKEMSRKRPTERTGTQGSTLGWQLPHGQGLACPPGTTATSKLGSGVQVRDDVGTIA